MSHFHIGAAFAAAIVLAGCNSSTPAAQITPPADCGAAALQGLIGKAVTGTTPEDAKVDGTAVQSKGVIRIFVSGSPLTMDFNEERLNLETDAAGNLVKATCG